MELRVLDECLALGGRGVALLSMDDDCAPLLKTGMTLVDARGARHELGAVSEHDGVWTLMIPRGDADYFARLLRDVRVDATRLMVEPSPQSETEKL